MAIFEPIIEALESNEVRYVVVGGFAVVLHGHARLTADIDLVLDLDTEEARKAIEVLTASGLRPTAPVDPLGFADQHVREAWRDEKGMVVFSLRDPADPLRIVDLFVDNPIEFERLRERSEILDLGSTTVRVASIEDLIEMKRMAGRTQDLEDIEALRAILERRRTDEG